MLNAQVINIAIFLLLLILSVMLTNISKTEAMIAVIAHGQLLLFFVYQQEGKSIEW